MQSQHNFMYVLVLESHASSGTFARTRFLFKGQDSLYLPPTDHLLGRVADLECLSEGGHDGRPTLVGILLLEGVSFLIPLGKVRHGLM